MATKPKQHDVGVSVIICAYNVEKYVGRAIASVLAQSHPALQVVVVDDASTDATPRIASSIASRDPRVVVVRRGANGGLAQARMTGIGRAEHEVLVFLDGDDVALPELIARQLAVLLSDDRILGVATHASYILEDESHVIGVRRIGPTSREQSLAMYREGKLMFLPATTMVRKSDVLAAGGFRLAGFPEEEGIRYQDYCDDLDLWCRMADLGAQGRYFVTIPEPLCLYRKSAATLSGNAFAMQAKMRWIKECLRRRRRGEREPTFDGYRRSLSTLQRANNLRVDIAAHLYKKAAYRYLRREHLRAVFTLAMCGVLNPKLVLQNMRVQKLR